MEWEPEQQDLGSLGFAGICREIYRVSLHAILPITDCFVGGAYLSVFLLAHIAAFRTLASGLVEDDGVDLLACAVFILSEVTFMCVLLLFSSAFTVLCVFGVASLYCTGGDSHATYRFLQNLPHAPLARFFRAYKYVILFPMLYIVFSAAAFLLLLQLDGSHEVVVLPLQVLGGAACLVSAAYVAVVAHIACVVALLEVEDAVLLGAVRKTRALLAGKLWAAAAVFLLLDGCFVALQIAFHVLVLDDALGLGVWFQIPAGAAVAVTLWVVVVVTLVAQPVMYLVCKNHHHEVVDKVHLDYVGDYQRLAAKGDSGVELQPVTTVEIPASSTSSQCPGQSPPAGSSTSS